VILAGDVGATKILLEVGEFRSERWQPALAKRYITGDVENFPAVLTSFLGEWNAKRERDERIRAAAFGVAGPAVGNKVKMTHRPLVVDGDAISSRFLIPRVVVVNDLAAAAHGIDWLGPRDVVTIQPGRASPEGSLVVMGVGTGLGIAYLVPMGAGYRVIAGEGGHAGFSPATTQQAELWRAVHAAHGRCSAEDVVSGVGLTHVFSFVRSGRVHALGETEDSVSPDGIVRGAVAGDARCEAALDLFVQCLGNVAGDHAVTVMARGGVYLTGGVVATLHPRFRGSLFSSAFCAKGPMSSALMKIPVRAVTSERVALLGAAKFVV